MPTIENRKDGEMFPRMGNDNDIFERLAEYIDAFDQTWKENIKPASKEQIEELRNVSQLKKYADDFPKSYLIFLETMGVDDGGLLSKYLIGRANIKVIIDLYREFQLCDPEVFETPYFAFFKNNMSVEYSLVLSGKHLGSILNTDSGEAFGKTSESFEKLLFQAAFQQFENFGYRIFISASEYGLEKAKEKHQIEEIFEEIERIGEKHQLKKAWFSDTINDVMLGTKLSFRVKEIEGEGATAMVTGDSAEIVEQVANEIADIIGAVVNRKELSKKELIVE